MLFQPKNNQGGEKVVFSLHLVFIGLAIGLVFFIRYLYLNKEKYDLKSVAQDATQVDTTTKTVSPTPEPVKTVIESYNIKIINSTGVSGLAAKTRDDLSLKGYKMISELGNGSLADETEVVFKTEDMKNSDLGRFLADKYQKSKVDSSLEFDIVLILGKSI